MSAHFADVDKNRRALQQALKDAGYDPGPIDGVLGARSAAAISSYRTDHEMGTGAVIDNRLLIALGLRAPDAPQPPKGLTAMQATIADYILNFLTSKIVWASAGLAAFVAAWINTKFGLVVPEDVVNLVTQVFVYGGTVLIAALRTFWNSPHVVTKPPAIVTKP